MKKTNDHTLTQLADAAFEQAARKVIERAEESGTPVIVWEQETVKQVEPRNTQKSRKSTTGTSAAKRVARSSVSRMWRKKTC